jgi:glycosyltransferase involved in cell wall biosynthesis
MNSTLNILVITPGFLPAIGGAEIGVHEIYSRLGRRHQVTILTPSVHSPQPVEGFDQSSYRVDRYRDFLNLGQVGGRMFLQGSLPPFSIGALYAAADAIRRLRPDAVNVHYAAYTGLAAVYAQRAARIPTLLSLIGRDAAPGPQVPRLWPWYSGLVASQVEHTVFISEFCRSFYQKYHFPCSVIPYGADIHKIAPQPAEEALRERLGIPPGRRILLSLQRLSPIKNVETSLRSVRELLDQGIDRFILLVGGDGPDQDRLIALARRLGLHDHVRFLGFIPEDQVGGVLSLADLFLFPSLFETFGIVLAQAMAAGLPVMASNTSSIPEVVQDGQTGLLSPPTDSKTLAGNIRRLLEDDALRERMGKAARKRAVELYDWDRVAGQYEQVLARMAGRHPTYHSSQGSAR